MRYHSLKNKSMLYSFSEALRKGLPADKSLFFPEKIHRLPKSFFQEINMMNINDMALEIIQPYTGKSLNKDILLKIINETLNFDFPLVQVSKNIYALELFHGPTLAFKDVGARFMSRCLSNILNEDEKITVLVATSGDTGGAVANGFMGIKGIDVIVLYPKDKVSDLQERQFTTLGKNIKAISVNGTFDDCQRFVKDAFVDIEINEKVNLTSANSINIARWLPQMFYYFICYRNLPKLNKKLAFSVPSGNFGNICSGILAKEMGLPIDHFIASTNINDAVPKYLKTGIYKPNPAKETISNAMDVGDPSNFIRIKEVYKHDHKEFVNNVSGYKFTDNQTRQSIINLYEACGYIADPHGAIAYLGLREFIENNESDYFGVFLETAHPIKFRDIVENEIKTKIKVPEQLKGILSKEKKVLNVDNFQDFKSLLLN